MLPAIKFDVMWRGYMVFKAFWLKKCMMLGLYVAPTLSRVFSVARFLHSVSLRGLLDPWVGIHGIPGMAFTL